MVILMILKSLNGDNLINKPQRDSAPELHQLFNQDAAPFKIPTARELILEDLHFRIVQVLKKLNFRLK